MRHRKVGKKLNMENSHRKAVIRNMLTSLIEHGQIQTTAIRCKILKREMDKLVTLGKKGTLHARRLAASRLYTPEAVQKLFDELAPRFANRNGGYTRIYRLGQRRGDGAHVGIVQILSADEAPSTTTETEE